MKLFFIIISIFFTLSVTGEELSVHSLSQGSCWIEKTSQHIKIASFNENMSLVVSGMVLSDFIDKVREKMNNDLQLDFNPKSLDLVAHCGTYGSSLIFNFTSKKQNICIWANTVDGGLTFSKILADHENHRGFCDGISLGHFIVKPRDINKMFTTLSNPKWKSRIESTERLAEGIYTIKFKKSEYFKEDALHDELTQSGLFEFVDFNSMNHPIGETLLLIEKEF